MLKFKFKNVFQSPLKQLSLVLTIAYMPERKLQFLLKDVCIVWERIFLPLKCPPLEISIRRITLSFIRRRFVFRGREQSEYEIAAFCARMRAHSHGEASEKSNRNKSKPRVKNRSRDTNEATFLSPRR
jgi:hypothetical protein